MKSKNNRRDKKEKSKNKKGTRETEEKECKSLKKRRKCIITWSEKVFDFVVTPGKVMNHSLGALAPVVAEAAPGSDVIKLSLLVTLLT